MALTEYTPGTTFPGVIGRTADVSTPAWPAPPRPPQGSPNILYIVIDDTGFGHLSSFGGLVETPNLDALAADGLRYSNMHTTALCSPSRSCMLTGRNHHSNHMAGITEISTGYPGYDGNIPFENGFLSEILLQQGYNTYAIGKWHLTPAEANSPAGPYNRWPLGRGFERYYGFLGGDTHQYYPELVRDNTQVEPEKTPEEGYHLTPDLVEKAIGMIADAKQIAPDKPFFMYFCTGAGHAPHHVPKEWADRYAGKFDDGWDAYREKVFARQKEMGIIPADTVLSRHDPDVQDWDSLPADEKRLYARMMEVFAGFLTHTDHYIGELIQFLKDIDQYDNTMIMVISDNGASPEGGPSGSVNENAFFNNVPDDLEQNLAAIDEIGGPKYFNHYPWGWTFAGNTPFRRWKRETFRGGVSDPFIVSWPAGIKSRGEIRSQYSHAIDMVPTVLDAIGITPPQSINGITQSPIEGYSFADSFDNAEVPSKHQTQYFEMFGHRSIYHQGWRAVCPWPGDSFVESGKEFGTPMSYEELTALDEKGWELFHIDEDFAEANNVAGDPANRARLIEMIGQWYVEAGKYNVLPIDSRGTLKFAEDRPQISTARTSYTYYPNTQAIPANAAADTFNRSHTITAEVEIPEEGAEGVLLSHGGNDGGFSFYMQDGKLKFVHNYVAQKYLTVESEGEVPAGHHALSFEFVVTGEADVNKGLGTPGTAILYIDDKEVGRSEWPLTTPIQYGLGGAVACGQDPGSPVTPDYRPPFKFTGGLKRVRVDLSGEPFVDQVARFKAMMARQ
jgi:arylsulfatase